MPRLSEVGDTAAVANQYADKVIVYVEGEDDVTIFYAISGQDIREYLEFRTPQVAGSGVRQVIEQVSVERTNNPRIYGLLDGEAAALLGEVDALLRCPGILFQIDNNDLRGLIFLAQHEVENLMLMHGDLCELILKDVKVGEFGAQSREDIEAEITQVGRRFFQAALIKYASMSLHHRAKAEGAEVGCKVIDSARFLAKSEASEVIDRIKESLADEGLISWDEIKNELCRTYRILGEWFRAEQLDRQRRERERLRLTDGKSVIECLKRARSPQGKWGGHLLHAMTRSEYGALFRAQLLEVTAA